ncbi:MAG: sugar ABC transporter permease [Acidimicrobiales bacterium]|nr:sugar ABC transporter permease [Acidimicrobiales bacterium]
MAPPRGAGERSFRRTLLAYAMLAPSLAVFVAFVYAPFVRTIGWGTYESRRGGTAYEQVGLAQYRDVLTGSDFWAGVSHSLVFVAITVPLGLLLGLLLAVLADRRLRGIRFFQIAFSSTVASSTAVTSVIFLYLFSSAGPLGLTWLQRESTALPAIALSSVWQSLGMAFIIILAGLQAIPEEVTEAARLDGYGPWRMLTRITVPLISPVLFFLVVVLVVLGFQAYAQVDLMTRGTGGPNGSAETLLFKVFTHSDPDRVTIGSVMSMGLFVLTGIVVFVQMRLLQRRVHLG